MTNEHLIRIIGKVMSDPELSKIFLSLESLEEACAFLQVFESEISAKELSHAINKINDLLDSISLEELKYIFNEMNKPIDLEYLEYIFNQLPKVKHSKILAVIADEMINIMNLDAKFEENKLLLVSGGCPMNGTTKRITSASMAAMIALTGTTANANFRASDFGANAGVNNQIVPSKNQKPEELTKQEESTWQAFKKSLGNYWKKIPKPLKVLGIVGTPVVVIGGVVVYRSYPTIINIAERFKLTRKLLELSNRVNSENAYRKDDLRALAGLSYIMQGWVDLGYPSKILIDLIDLFDYQIHSNTDKLNQKLNSLGINDMILLSQALQYVEENSSKSSINIITKEISEFYQDFNNERLTRFAGDINRLINYIPECMSYYMEPIKEKIFNRLQSLLSTEVLKQFGFTFKSHLGTGQSGGVYLCTDKNDQEVAVKIMPKNGTNVSFASKENEEAVWETIKDVQSGNVVKYREKFSKDGITCFVMDFIKGSLDLSKASPTSRNEVIDWAIDIYSGLNELHKKDVIHRDIKFENILLGSDGKIRLCDYGLAKHSTSGVTICGTPGMMPPEVNSPDKKTKKIRKKGFQKLVFTEPYDAKKFDVYSSAMVVYCLMFDKKTKDILYDQNKNYSADAKDRFGGEIGLELSEFFEKCLNEDPNQRITAEQALQLLQNIKSQTLS